MLLTMVTVSGMAVAQPAAVVRLWPGAGPGEGGKVGTERDTTPKGPDGKPQDNIIRLGDVSEPTLTITLVTITHPNTRG